MYSKLQKHFGSSASEICEFVNDAFLIMNSYPSLSLQHTVAYIVLK